MMNIDRKISTVGLLACLLGQASTAVAQAATNSAEASGEMIPALYPPHPARAKSNPALWVVNKDYPVEAIAQGMEGSTQFRLLIGKDGLVAKCIVLKSSGYDLLDATTCRLLSARATFKPATDDHGKPTEDTFTSRFNWVIP